MPLAAFPPISNDGSEIRLAAIQPGSGPDPIAVRTFGVKLLTCGKYEALSYHWDPPESSARFRITLNGHARSVGQNLYGALRELRFLTERIMWIDSLCIDQDDQKEEKSIQVRLMKTIYSKAATTIAWLGSAKPETPGLFQALQEMGFPRRYHGALEKAMTYQRFAELKARLRVDTHLQHNVREGYYGDLAQRPYWKRIWIVEEIVLSSKVFVMCGANTILWETFGNATFYLDHATAEAMPDFWQATPGAPTIRHIDYVRLICKATHFMTIGDVVALFRSSRAVKYKDKIYGLLGFLPDGGKSLQVDYTSRTSTAEVYTDFVKHYIKAEKSLDIICVRRRTTITPGLASWVPDWQDERDVKSEYPPPHPLVLKWVDGCLLQRATVIGDSYLKKPVLWNATDAKLPDCTVADGPTRLRVRGINVGKVIAVGRPLLETEASNGLPWFYKTFLNWEELVLQAMGNRLSTGIDLRRTTDFLDQCLVIWDGYLARHQIPTGHSHAHLLERRRARPSYNTTREPYAGGGCFVKAFALTLLGDRDNDWKPINDAQLAAFWTREKDYLDDWEQLLKCLQVAMNRRFFITDSGYIGLGPMAIAEEDTVCVWYGCAIPVVLRKEEEHEDEGRKEAEGRREDGLEERYSEDEYTFVGECFVQGIMKGEAVADDNRGRLIERFWVVR